MIILRSQVGTPNTSVASLTSGIRRFVVLNELLREDRELRAVLIDTDVRTAHPALSVKRGAAVEDSVVVDD